MRTTGLVARRAAQVTAFALLALCGCTKVRGLSHSSAIAGPLTPGGLGRAAATDGSGQMSRELIPEESFRPRADSRARVLVAWGQTLEGVGRLSEAADYYEQAIKADPKCLKALLALARSYGQLGRPQAALDIYQRAAKLYPKEARVFNDWGLHYVEMKQWRAAVKALEKATRLEPSSSKYHNNLGLALALSGDYAAAWRQFRAAVGPAKAYYNVAQMLLQAGQESQARDNLQRALALMPDLEPARALLTQLGGPPRTQPAQPAKTVPPPDDGHALRPVAYEQIAQEPATQGQAEQPIMPVLRAPVPKQTPDPEDPWSTPFAPLDWLR